MKPGSSICEIGKAWLSYGLSLFLLFTLDYLSEHSYSHTGLILFITGNLLSYLHFAFCLLYGWLNVSVPLIDLTIRAALGNHVILRDWKGGILETWINGGPKLEGEWADLKEGTSDHSSYYEGDFEEKLFKKI